MNEQTAQVPGNWFHYAAYKAAGWLAATLPVSTQYKIAALAADVYFKLDARARESVLANLDAVYGPKLPPAKLRHNARGVFQSFGRYLCEFLSYQNFSGEFIDRHVAVRGREHIDAALKAGRGVIFCSGHYSNWELGPAIVARMGYPVLAVTQMHANPKIDALFVAQRAARGVQIVHSQHGALQGLKALRRNQTVALLGDRLTGGPAVSVDFFGRKTALPQGPWRMALRSGAALLPTFVSRRADGYDMEISAPISISGYTDLRAGAAALAQIWAGQFETLVRRDPAQWEVFQPVWGELEENQAR